ncbi:MAG: DUF1569 domain-containing protein [Bacteroidia bacterium]|nr:DUF1569 domain-containing protein [Bacteroidia bacterium]
MKGNILNPAEYEAILKRIGQLAPDSQRQWGTMNVNQMVAHCADQLRMVFGEMEIKDISTGFTRTVFKFLVLHVIPVPKGKAPTLPELDQRTAGTSPTELEADKKTLVNLLDRFIKLGPLANLAPHGRFGAMSREQWGRMIMQHLDHHLKQFGV